MVQPKYQIIANGAYQLPYQIDLGVNYLIRQGYPMPWFQPTTKTGNLLCQNAEHPAGARLRPGPPAGDADVGHAHRQDDEVQHA